MNEVPRDETAALQWAIESFRNNARIRMDPSHIRERRDYNALLLNEFRATVETIQRGDTQSIMVPDSFETTHRMDHDELLDLIACARKDGEVYEYLLAIAAALIENGYALPAPLKEFVVGFLQNPKVPRPGRGRKRATLSPRDNFIAWVVSMICLRWKFHATRNEATERASAASITQKALSQVGIYLTEAAINKIWNNSIWKPSIDRQKELAAIK